MEQEDKQVFCTFTSANIYLLVNDHLLGGVNTVVVKDFKEPTGHCTRISLDRVVFDGTQDVVEAMRTQRFSFKLMNNTTQSGWVSLDAELESYEMSISAEESGVLHQSLVVKTSAFVYAENISAEHMAAKEEEDLKNLIEILKKNQAATKDAPPAAVLPTDDEFDAAAKSAFEFYKMGEQMDVKKEKKKKKKKKK